MDLEMRVRMAAESILENEALREGLDKEAAAALMDWGVACAKQIARESAETGDDTAAEQAMEARMSGLGKLLQLAARLATEPLSETEQAALLEQLSEAARPVYREQTPGIGPAGWQSVPKPARASAAGRIRALRGLIENHP